MKLAHAPKRLIGLTGSIASGKSAALDFFAQAGAYVLSADALVHELYQRPEVQQQFKKWFGSAERSQIAHIVFSSAQARRRVEKYLHPLVWQLALERLAAADANWAVFEAPLLFEVGWDTRTDLTLLIVADPATLKTRLAQRGLSQAAYQRRRCLQMSDEEKMRRADIVIFNNSTKQALKLKIQRIYQTLQALYA